MWNLKYQWGFFVPLYENPLILHFICILHILCNMHWSFGRYQLNRVMQVFKCWHILHNIKKSYLLILQDIRRVFKYGEAVKFMMLETRFPKLFHLKAWVLSLAQMLSLVFLEMTDSLSSFLRVSIKYLNVDNYSSSVVLYSKKDVLWKMWLDRLGAKTVTRVLCLKTGVALWYAAKVLHGYFPFRYTEY